MPLPETDGSGIFGLWNTGRQRIGRGIRHSASTPRPSLFPVEFGSVNGIIY
jgi:hypothetical protein